MITKIYHLNCATLKSLGGAVVCHCLLLETEKGLILVDTGLGVEDVKNPKQRLDFQFRLIVNPTLRMEETAFHQIKKLGFSSDDVRYIILSHLHEDHVGGIDDFPNATMITTKAEYDFVFSSGKKGTGYNKKQMSGQYNWLLCELNKMKWNGFDACAVFEDSNDLLLVDLKGHTAGQCGLVIKWADKTYFFCADGYYSRKTLVNGGKKTPFQYKLLQFFVSHSRKDAKETESKIVNLFQREKSIELFCAHDVNEFNALRKQ